MRYAFLLLFPFWLFASQILSYNVYDRTDRVDIMLTFDTPFEGSLRQQRQNDAIIIKLDDAQIESVKQKQLNSPFLSKLTISPSGSGTQIIARVPEKITMQASKTADAYGLRLRFLTASSPTAASDAPSQPSLSALPTKSTDGMEQSYISVAIILIIGILIIFWLKRSMQQRAGVPSQSSLFGKKAPSGTHATAPSSQEGATIRFQKPLDAHNSVMMLEYAQASYLVIIGTNNIVLDKFYGERPVTESDFETILKKNEAQLESYMQIDNVESTELLQSYKDKASG